MKKELIALFIIGTLFGYCIGYSVGFGAALNWSVKTGLNFLKANGIDIKIDAGMVFEAFNSYQNQLNYCRTENAFVFNNTGN